MALGLADVIKTQPNKTRGESSFMKEKRRKSAARKEEIAKFFDDHPEMSISEIADHFGMSKSGVNIYKPKGRSIAERHHKMLTEPPPMSEAVSAFRGVTDHDFDRVDDISIYEGIKAVFRLKCP